MKVGLTASGVLALAAVAAVVGVVVFNRRAIGGAAAAAVDAVNPASEGNLAARAVNAAGAAVSGDAQFSLGGWLAERFSPSVRAANDSLSAPIAPTYTDETDRLLRRYPGPDAVFSGSVSGSW